MNSMEISGLWNISGYDENSVEGILRLKHIEKGGGFYEETTRDFFQ
ncbi:hypothetical protein [Paenibacillus dendritiformis]|nr:hypothetical protein [Paenibacillus dendritiformis]